MARPKSEDRQNAIMSAAIRVIASKGLGAATATIAKEAGVSSGSLFTYYETKAHLLNELFLELKAEMAKVALDELPTESEIRMQVLHMWSRWLRWATSSPEKRRVLELLSVADEITQESHQAANLALRGMRELLQRSSENGHMRDAPLGFIVSIMFGLAEATINYMLFDPANADKHCMAGFEAFWRTIS
ncbi:TetR/AcrR family transcriptional regulator [Paenibacillus glycinis]|uniref:TetR family transcriptional regulator n=1 Tax=Paenibacillus glycinis TaxID=2697035 RepID=A0ABW9XR19_9BACL|nr:TetR/AcrR family transcriptional regulator [Paenibacillus glycinis]NBD25088.1 TetR family transcriptional regulator [Paenibacillus glycinis]